MPLRAELVVEGNWSGWGKEIVSDLAAANTAAMRRATDGLKSDMRGAVRAAGLGRRLGFTIASEVYPKGRVSLEPAGVLRARGKSAEKILEAYTEGVTIRGRRGWLAIPIKQNLPVLGRNTKATPDLVEKRLGRPLRWVKPKGKTFGLLVADTLTRGLNNRRIKTYNPRSKRQRATSEYVGSLPMFVLVRQVQVRRRLAFAPLVRHWIDQLPRLVAAGSRT